MTTSIIILQLKEVAEVAEEEEAVVEDEVATDIGVMSKKMKAQRNKRCRRALASIQARRP